MTDPSPLAVTMPRSSPTNLRVIPHANEEGRVDILRPGDTVPIFTMHTPVTLERLAEAYGYWHAGYIRGAEEEASLRAFPAPFSF